MKESYKKFWGNLKILPYQALDDCVARAQSGVAVGGVKFVQDEGLRLGR